VKQKQDIVRNFRRELLPYWFNYSNSSSDHIRERERDLREG